MMKSVPVLNQESDLLSEEVFLSHIPRPAKKSIRALRVQHRVGLNKMLQDHQEGIRVWLDTFRGRQAAAEAANNMLDVLRSWVIQEGLARALELWIPPTNRETSTVWPHNADDIELNNRPTRRFINKSFTNQPTFRQSGRAPAGYDGRYLALTCACIQHHLKLEGPFTSEHFIAFFDVIHTWISRISALQNQTIDQMGNRTATTPNTPDLSVAPPTSPTILTRELEDVVDAILAHLDKHFTRHLFVDRRFAFQLRKIVVLAGKYAHKRFLSVSAWTHQETTLTQQAAQMEMWPLYAATRATPPTSPTTPTTPKELLADDLLGLSLQCMTPRATNSLRAREALGDALYLLSEELRKGPDQLTFGHVFSALKKFT